MKNYRQILSVLTFVSAMSLTPLTLSAAPTGESIEMGDEVVAAPTITVNGQQVEIEISDDESHQILIYALTGQIVKNISAESGRTVIDLPRGYYIVKVDKTTKRVIIK